MIAGVGQGQVQVLTKMIQLSFPIPYGSIPAARGQFGLFIGVPLSTDANLLVSLQSPHYGSTSPIPNDEVASDITRIDEFAIGREANLAGVPTSCVSNEPFTAL